MPGWHAGMHGMRPCKKKKTNDRYFFVSLIVTYDTKDSSNYVWKNLCFPYLSLAKTHQEFYVYTCLWGHSWTWIFRNTLQRSFSLAKNKLPTLNECSHRLHLFCTTILRPPESFEKLSKEIMYLAAMFLTLFALDIIYFTFFPIIVCAQTCLK